MGRNGSQSNRIHLPRPPPRICRTSLRPYPRRPRIPHPLPSTCFPQLQKSRKPNSNRRPTTASSREASTAAAASNVCKACITEATSNGRRRTTPSHLPKPRPSLALHNPATPKATRIRVYPPARKCESHRATTTPIWCKGERSRLRRRCPGRGE